MATLSQMKVKGSMTLFGLIHDCVCIGALVPIGVLVSWQAMVVSYIAINMSYLAYELLTNHLGTWQRQGRKSWHASPAKKCPKESRGDAGGELGVPNEASQGVKQQQLQSLVGVLKETIALNHQASGFKPETLDRTSSKASQREALVSYRSSRSSETAKEKVKRATTYYEWFEAACQMEDPSMGASSGLAQKHHDWKDYDKVLLRDRIACLKAARKSGDIHYLKETLRGDLVRNLGHIANSSVFDKKVLPPFTVEQYICEVVKDLRHVMEYRGTDFSLDEKIKYITEIYYSYGSTGLLLSGGGSLGCFHFGVLKALIDQDCLPHIIAGSSAGSVIAAIACTRSFADLKAGVHSDAIRNKESWFKFKSLSEIFRHYWKYGHLQDQDYFQNWLKELLGDLTFLEAKQISGKILNVVVSAAHTNEPPRVLNYINSPNVLVRSAVSASCAFPLLFPPQDLYVKQKNGKIVPFGAMRSLKRTKSGRWHDGTLGEDLPISNLKEYFHVNYSIVSQTNLHAAPWLTVKRHLPRLLAFLVESEFKHRFRQLGQLFASRRLKSFLKVLHTSWEGDITIVLPMNPAKGLLTLTKAVLGLRQEQYWGLLDLGERSTWPKIQGIKCMTAIESEITRSITALNRLRSDRDASHLLN